MKAVLLDRDGTLNIDEGYTHKIEDFKLHEGVIDGLKLLSDYKLFIVTNQGGVAKGKFTLQEMHAFNTHLRSQLLEHDIHIEDIVFAPQNEEQQNNIRKPNPYLAQHLAKVHNINLKESFVIGDKATDIAFANNCGAAGILVLTGNGKEHLDTARKENPHYIAKNFRQAARMIAHSGPKIIDREEIENKVAHFKQEGKSICFLNGSFDIIHQGHHKFLKEASEQGDLLIVGLNSDRSIRKNKGPNRPFNSELKRCKMMSSLPYVDYVTVFDEPNPIPLIQQVKPDVFVNGADYGEDCIEAPVVKELGGRVHIISLVEGISTTILTSKEKK